MQGHDIVPRNNLPSKRILPELSGPEDLQKGKCKKNGTGAKIIDYVHCPIANEMEKRLEWAFIYRCLHVCENPITFFVISTLFVSS